MVAAGTPVLRLAHDGPRDVVFSVPEDKVALSRRCRQRRARRGAPVGRDGDELPATVREVAAAPTR